jgi:adenosylcobyric acid synthase
MVILPGTKSTRGDLAFLRAQGWDVDLHAHVRRGGKVLGICGGYQMLGHTIDDRGGLDGASGRDRGLGLLNVETRMASDKTLSKVTAVHCASGAQIDGYEIHIGQTAGPDCTYPFSTVNGIADGAQTKDGQIAGTYLHGLFSNDVFRAAWLKSIGVSSGGAGYSQLVEDTLDQLADHMEKFLDVPAMLACAAPVGK